MRSHWITGHLYTRVTSDPSIPKDDAEEDAPALEDNDERGVDLLGASVALEEDGETIPLVDFLGRPLPGFGGDSTGRDSMDGDTAEEDGWPWSWS